MQRRIVALFVAASVALALLLVDAYRPAPEWMRGAWRFDLAATSRHLRDDERAGLPSLFGGIPVVPAPEYLDLRVGRREIAFLNGNAGPTRKFHVLSAGSSQCRIKFEDGTLAEYDRDGAALFQLAEGELPFRTYYKRRP